VRESGDGLAVVSKVVSVSVLNTYEESVLVWFLILS
jgi:hypothetical protein